MDDEQDFDLLVLTLLFGLAADLLQIIEREEQTKLQDHIKEQRRLCRRLPAEKTRPTWTGFCNRVSDSHFRRQFRMTRNVFTNLCNILCAAVGEETFRPEDKIMPPSNSASLLGRGGLIPGEIKTAIALRLLAGGSYLDLAPLFDVSGSHIYVIFDEVLDWVLQALQFPLGKFLDEENWVALGNIAEAFSYNSNGAFSGIIGALDGIAIRIRSPYLSEVSDPGNYYCRKGFFALNVQAICDRAKKFLWCYISNKGSTHDSLAFSNSRLFSLLTQKARQLEEKGFCLVGDSAYNLTSFLLTPYSTEEVRQDRSGTCDTFNFFLSSSRIYIECAFGELVRRWGILWRTLSFDLTKSQKIVQVCMLLHNLIKDENENENENDFNDLDWQPFSDNSTGQPQPDERPFPLVTDNNEIYLGGRRRVINDHSRVQGEMLRQSIAIHLQLQGLQRPMHSGMR